MHRTILAIIAIFCTGFLAAQVPSSSVWSLSADGNAVITGNLTGNQQSLSNLQAQYNSGNQRVSPLGTAGTWPGNPTEVPDRYMQFSVSPTAGYAFSCSSLSMILFSSAGSNMRANVYYSKDSTFTERTQIGSTFSLSSTAPVSPNVAAAPGLTVNPGETLYLRVYPWYTTATTTKYIVTKSVTISGTANSSVAILSSVNALQGFVQTSVAASAIQSYELSGNNLTGSVTISIPEQFEISTNAGQTWNNSSTQVVLPVSGGAITGQPISVAVRLHANSAGEYSAELKHESVGAPNNIILLSGTRLAEEPSLASTISFTGVTGNGMDVHFANGNGGRRVLIGRAGSATNWLPSDGTPVSGTNSNFTNAYNLADGNKALYDGDSSVVTITGLNSNTTYYFSVFEYNTAQGNSQNYLTVNPGTGNHSTLTVSELLAVPTQLDFGIAVFNNDTIVKQYTLTGKYLTAGGGTITITAPTGYTVSENANGVFAANLQFAYTGNAFTGKNIYVKFVPVTLGSYTGSILNAGGGVQAMTVQVIGKGVSSIIQTDAPVGFASLNGGTTGGAGGTSVIISSAAQLAEIMRLRENKITTPLIVYIQGTLSGYTTQISVKRTANISILGLGTDAKFLGFGMKVVDCQNIIVRNITFADCKVDEKDGLGIDGSVNVWVDHCSFTDSPSSDPSGSNHDGQLDVKSGASNVTLSFNHFMNHRKTCLLGHTPGQTSDSSMKVTYYANWFDGTYSRNPRIRFAKTHVLNNLYSNNGIIPDNGGYGIGVTCNAQVLAEGNYFENTLLPTLISTVNDPGGTLSGDPAGFIKSLNNVTVNSGTIVENLGSYNFDPHSFYSYSAFDAQAVKNIVSENAGAGILNITTAVETKAHEAPNSLQLLSNYPNPFNPSTIIRFSLPGSSTAVLKVYDMLGNEVATLFNSEAKQGTVYSVTFDASKLASGIYLSVLQSGGTVAVQKMMLMK
ncbi:MAG: T9SS type A sorting domain-containing protein [Ignavibacteriales bacterium]|nr:T9SS type A sorting domain-containing protein [Ignavibacteriales bacterium]